LLPGDGELDLGALVHDLRAIGATAPVGIEVFSDQLDALEPTEVGRRAGAALRRLLGA
jgi:sugar phosphate isomerase/epimerase